MKERAYSKGEWSGALAGLARKYKVYVPVREGDIHLFRVMGDGTPPDFEFQNTRLSPKGILYPPSERIFECALDGKDPNSNTYREAEKDYGPTAIIGIRPCDAHAIQIMKRNLDGPDVRDPWWASRFESSTLVGLGCESPCSTCFCTSVGGGPFSAKGLDVLLFPVGDQFLATAATPKGETFLDEIGGGSDADEKLRLKASEVEKTSESGMGRGISTERIREKTINDLFGAPFWEETAFACINCGTCTFLCPTCWCFDIQDEVCGKIGDRLRNWDSCMFPLFTLHGSGHNPREKKFQRVRQRFMHKLKYYQDKYKAGVQCSGCGRCVRHCPVNIDIREVAERMNGA